MNELEVARQLLRHITKDNQILYVLCPYDIGDFLINGGLCHALVKKKRKQACVLIERDRFTNSGLNFVGVMEVRYIPQAVMDFLREYIWATHEYETDNFVYGHLKVKQNPAGGYSLIHNENLSITNLYKESVFGLPLDTEVLPPIIEPPTDFQKQMLNKNYVVDKERTIIIAPYATSVKNLEEIFWVKLVEELKRKNENYVVYTNVGNPKEKVIPGTLPMFTTFQELLYIAEKVNCFIGLRSGLFDLLALTNARLLYINPRIQDWYGDLKINYNHTNSKAFYIGIFDLAKLQAFMKINNLTSIDNINFYNCVMGKDLFFDGISLINRIVYEVN